MIDPQYVLGAMLGIAVAVGATAQTAPQPPYEAQSTSFAPCGKGTPPPGHESPELRAGSEPIVLTVRQDGSRLCYVAAENADAPVIRVRQGGPFVITLRNEITDPSAIEAATAPGKVSTPNQPVPAIEGYYKVVPGPGMEHGATGATNLHVHGFAVPPVAPQDDVMTVCTDPASGPTGCGRREFTYRYQVPVNMPAGLYWYHPHMHGEVQAQMLMGLAGAIVVEGPADDARRAAGIDERVLIVRQTQDLDAGKRPTSAMISAPPLGPDVPQNAGPARAASQVDTSHELLCASNSGIDEISLNGTPVPVGESPDSDLARLEVKSNRKQLWRILNAATDAFLDLSIQTEDGTALPWEIVARDGFPLTDDAGRALQRPPTTQSQHVPPAGRLEVLVSAPQRGVKAYLVTHAIDTGCAGDRLPERRLAVLVAGPPESRPKDLPSKPSRTVPSLFAGLLERKTERTRVIALAEYPRPGSNDQTDFYIFERKPGAILRPFRMGDAPAITVTAGTTEEWEIENWTNELHAFHMHQVHFRVLTLEGKRILDAPLLDVVEVPSSSATGYHSKEGPIRPGRIRIKLYFPASLAGDIPFHCHLVDHEDNGMMAVLRVLAPDHAPPEPAS